MMLQHVVEEEVTGLRVAFSDQLQSSMRALRQASPSLPSFRAIECISSPNPYSKLSGAVGRGSQPKTAQGLLHFF